MAGAGFKVYLTGDVLTATDVNTYLQQQTVMVFAAAAARTSALSAVLAEGMVSYLQDTNTVEVYNGTAWVAVGGSTGGMTLINTGGTALSGGTVTVSSIPATYKHLYLVVTNARTSSAGINISLRFNSDTASNYGYANVKNIANTAYLGGSQSATAIDEFLLTPSASTVTHQGQLEAWIPNYATTGGVAFHFKSFGNNGSAAAGYFGSAGYNNAAAISSISFIPQATHTFTNGTIYVYGVS
jgi:hypothetical protein